MNARWNTSRQAPAPRPERSNPFGAVSPAIDPHHTVTLADAVRRCRWIAVDINAAAFTLLLVGPPGDKRRLIPSFDSDYPGQSALTRPLAAQIGEWAAGPRGRLDNSRAGGHSRSTTRSYASLRGAGLGRGAGRRPGRHVGHRVPGLRRSRPGRAGGLPRRRNCARQRHGRRHPRALVRAVCRRDPAEAGRRRQLPAISKRELECLSLTANGLTSEEIAAELGLSVHTANQYLTNTAQKLDAVNRMHAVAKALRLGLID